MLGSRWLRLVQLLWARICVSSLFSPSLWISEAIRTHCCLNVYLKQGLRGMSTPPLFLPSRLSLQLLNRRIRERKVQKFARWFYHTCPWATWGSSEDFRTVFAHREGAPLPQVPIRLHLLVWSLCSATLSLVCSGIVVRTCRGSFFSWHLFYCTLRPSWRLGTQVPCPVFVALTSGRCRCGQVRGIDCKVCSCKTGWSSWLGRGVWSWEHLIAARFGNSF